MKINGGQNASPTNEVFLERARISKDFVLGIEGRGQVNALETLNVGRAGLSLSSLALSEDVLDAAIEISSDSDDDMALLGKMSERGLWRLCFSLRNDWYIR